MRDEGPTNAFGCRLHTGDDMMTDDGKKTMFVLGAGKGCGNSVARRFGREGFRVVLMSRSAERLAGYAEEFRAEGIEVDTAVADASDPASVDAAFDAMIGRYGVPDVLFYNVGVTTPDPRLDRPVDSELLVERYRTDVAGAYHAIRRVMCEEFERKGGSILVTGGGLALHPHIAFLPLSMDKAALRAMCLALHDDYAERGVYVGILTVTGLIAPGERCDPEVLAEDFWGMYTRRDGCETVRRRRNTLPGAGRDFETPGPFGDRDWTPSTHRRWCAGLTCIAGRPVRGDRRGTRHANKKRRKEKR